jgi:hypothetical protein
MKADIVNLESGAQVRKWSDRFWLMGCPLAVDR